MTTATRHIDVYYDKQDPHNEGWAFCEDGGGASGPVDVEAGESLFLACVNVWTNHCTPTSEFRLVFGYNGDTKALRYSGPDDWKWL